MNIDLLTTPPDNRRHSPNVTLRRETVLESKDEWSPEDAHSIDKGPLVRVFDEVQVKSLREGQALLWFYGGIVYEEFSELSTAPGFAGALPEAARN